MTRIHPNQDATMHAVTNPLYKYRVVFRVPILKEYRANIIEDGSNV